MADTSIEERPAPCPPAEEERLRALYELDLIGGKRNEQIDRICALARDLFKVPIALVNLVDRDRVVTVSGFGLDDTEFRREDAICSTTILADTPLVLEDAAADPRFADNVYVRRSPKIRFYAGAPLRLRPGINIGTLCIIDVEPRSFGAAERANLAALADMIVSEIRGRRAALDLSTGQKLLAQTAQMAKIGSWELRPPSDRMVWDDVLYAIFGIARGTPLTIESIIKHYDPAMRQQARLRTEALLTKGIPYDTEMRGTRSNGEVFWIRTMAEAEKTDGKVTRLIGAVQDITALKLADARLHQLAFRDPLTGLPNRASFLDTLERYIDIAQATGARVALLKFNLDHFRDVNDALGQQAGDALLKAVAEGLWKAFIKVGTVTHIGGDEFAVIMHGPSVDKAAQYAKDFVERAKTLFRYEHSTLPIGISAGIAIFPEHAEDSDSIMKNAKVALFQAKAQRRGSVMMFDPEIRKAADEKDALVRKIREGIENKEFIMYYQPIVALRSGRVVGLEALMRWKDSERGILAPASFMIGFEEPELAVKLGNVALDLAIAQMRAWLDARVRFGSVAVNLSTAQFRLVDLADIILAKLAAAGVPPKRLTLEVTENVYMAWGADVVAETVRKLHAAGISISLDDFGTGYASLTHLRRFPIDKIKIDKSFVQSIESTPIVDAVINMALSLGMKVVAEGVEQPEHLVLLRLKGCTYVQGYVFAKPLEADRVADFISAFRYVAPKRIKKAANG